MAKSKKNEYIEEEGENKDQLDKLLDEYKGLHYGSRSGNEIKPQDKITTSSFFFNHLLEGGFRAGSWSRWYGDPETGKSSMGLCWGKNWQDHYEDDGFVVVFNAEGRITKDLLDRSGINTDKEKFRIIDCNNADVIFTIIEKLVIENSEKRRYFVVLDSTDACQRSQDIGKNLGEAEKIGGNATIQSAAGKRLSLPFNRSNHFLYMTSQMRDKMNTHSPGVQGKDPSGGNAPKFYNSLVGHIQKPWTDTYIFEDPSDTKSKIIGRLVQIKLIKTPNEKSNQIVQFPVLYGLKGGVWPAYEAMMMCQAWDFYKKDGKVWWSINEEFAQELVENNIKFEPKFQGEKNMRDYFSNNEEFVRYVFNKMNKLIT